MLQHGVYVQTTMCFEHVLVVTQLTFLMTEDFLVLLWQPARSLTPLECLRGGGNTALPPARRGALRRVYAPPVALKWTTAAIGLADDSASRFTAVSEASDACADLLPRLPSVCSPSELDGSTSGIELCFRGILTLFTAKLATEEVCTDSNTSRRQDGANE